MYPSNVNDLHQLTVFGLLVRVSHFVQGIKPPTSKQMQPEIGILLSNGRKLDKRSIQ